MAPDSVRFVRSAALCVLAGLAVAPGALGASGGAVLPGGPVEPDPSTIPVAATPAVDPANATTEASAPLAALSPALLKIPALLNVSWKPGDPVTTDIAALAAPSAIAAVDGHVVVVRSRGGRSELVDVADPANPRVVLASTRPFGIPHAGHDADGHPVIVASPCAGTDDAKVLGGIPRCPLRAVDLVDGASRPLQGTTGALAGDLERDWLAFTRPSPTAGVRLYQARSGTTAAVPLPRFPAPADKRATPISPSIRAGGLDIDGQGRLAVVLEYAAALPKATSVLWVRSTAGAWASTARATTPYADLGARRVLGPRLDAGGVSAYVEGVIESPSYIGRWSDSGAITTKTSIRRSIGRTTIVNAAAYDGTRLLFEDWLPGAPCGAEAARACGLRSAGPITLK